MDATIAVSAVFVIVLFSLVIVLFAKMGEHFEREWALRPFPDPVKQMRKEAYLEKMNAPFEKKGFWMTPPKWPQNL